MSITVGNTYVSSVPAYSASEVLKLVTEVAGELADKDRTRKKQFEESVMRMAPCPECGKRVLYDTDPELIHVCRHVRDRLIAKCPDSRVMGSQYPASFEGIPVEVY